MSRVPGTHKIVENKSYWNLATYLMQLGLTLEQAAPPQP